MLTLRLPDLCPAGPWSPLPCPALPCRLTLTLTAVALPRRCKLFYKKDNEFKEKGVGTLHLKPTASQKTQLLVRADTNLGECPLRVAQAARGPCLGCHVVRVHSAGGDSADRCCCTPRLGCFPLSLLLGAGLRSQSRAEPCTVGELSPLMRAPSPEPCPARVPVLSCGQPSRPHQAVAQRETSRSISSLWLTGNVTTLPLLPLWLPQ